MHKLVRIEASPAYGTQFGLSFVWDGERVTGSNPHGTGGLADTFMIGWPLPKVGEALRRLADSLDMVARGAESETPTR